MHRYTPATFIVLGLIGLLSVRTLAQEPPRLKLSEIEAKVIDLTNKERNKAKLPPLRPNADLLGVARKHTANMVKQDTLAHVLDGKTLKDRILASEYRYSIIAENLAWDPNSPEATMKAWMASEVHRVNILDKGFTEIGVGVITDKDGYTWYTQVFGTQRPPE